MRRYFYSIGMKSFFFKSMQKTKQIFFQGFFCNRKKENHHRNVDPQQVGNRRYLRENRDTVTRQRRCCGHIRQMCPSALVVPKAPA